MSRTGIATRGPAARARTEAQKDSLAEHVANGGSISAWSRETNTDDSWTWQLWAKIRRGLGAQAV